jgi:hypothetical protein
MPQFSTSTLFCRGYLARLERLLRHGLAFASDEMRDADAGVLRYAATHAMPDADFTTLLRRGADDGSHGAIRLINAVLLLDWQDPAARAALVEAGKPVHAFPDWAEDGSVTGQHQECE